MDHAVTQIVIQTVIPAGNRYLPSMATFILHPTLDCNSNCLHCGMSLLHRKTSILPEELFHGVENIAEAFCYEKKGSLKHYLFHGGEPTLVGTDYIEKFVDLTADQNCSYSIQTNLTLYDKKWGGLFNKHNFRMSTSYDFFSGYRRLANQDYYTLWKDKIKQYQDDTGEIPFVTTIVSKRNLPYIEEIIDFAHELKIHPKLNPLYLSGKAKNISDQQLTPQEYGDILVRAYRRWQKYRKEIVFSQGETFESLALRKITFTCDLGRSCVGGVFAILPDGDTYKCGICSQFQIGYLGNALNNTLDITKYIEMKLLASVIPEECSECGICGGGCIIDYATGRLTNKKTTRCEAYKMLYREVKDAGIYKTNK